MKQRFFKCQRCGQITNVVNDTNLTMMCCMADMLELIPNTSEGSSEKHLPEITANGTQVTVKVGTGTHPMETGHYIQWICIQTRKGCQRVHFEPGDKPEATFVIAEDDSLEAAYAYCNLHELWMKECVMCM